MLSDQHRKAERFRALHMQPGAFVIPNPWDAGTARILASLGFQALATTSAGLAVALGKPDGQGAVTLAETLANAAAIVAATDLPVSADLENCFADDPREAAATIRAAAGVGLVGGSIEDASGDAQAPIYDFALAVERVAASVEVVRGLPFPFMLTARAEGFLHGQRDLDAVIRRLQAYEQAGADVLFAPGLPDLAAIRTVCASVGKPVNVLISNATAAITLDELAEAGAKRISVGSALSRVALGAFRDAARGMAQGGRFDALAGAMPYAEVNALMAQP